MKINEIITEKKQRTNELVNVKNIPVLNILPGAVNFVKKLGQGDLKGAGEEAVRTAVGNIPIGAGILSAKDAYDALKKGDGTDAALSAVSSIPGTPGQVAQTIQVAKGLGKNTGIKTKKIPQKDYDQATQDAGF